MAQHHNIPPWESAGAKVSNCGPDQGAIGAAYGGSSAQVSSFPRVLFVRYFVGPISVNILHRKDPSLGLMDPLLDPYVHCNVSTMRMPS